MRKPLYLLVFVLGLTLVFAVAQTGGSGSQTPATSGSQTPSTQDQTPSGTQTPGTQTSAGGDVQTQIQDALKNDPNLSNADINVAVTDKEITLTGTVPSGKDKKNAQKIAEKYAGGKKIVDHLKVSGGKSSDKPDKGGDTMPKSNFMASSQVPGSSATPGQAGNPSNSTNSGSTSTQSAPQSSPSNGGAAGAASGQSSTQTAPSASTTTETQTPGPQASPASTGDLQMQIQNALKNEPTLANDSVNVSVTNDEIALSGTVASGKEKQTAKRIAQSYAGNLKVKDQITVAGRGQNAGSTQPDNGNTSNPASNPDSNKNNPPAGSKPPRN